jgi:hypothetical protein
MGAAAFEEVLHNCCSWEVTGESVEWASRNHFTWYPVSVNVMQEAFF